MQLSRVLTGIPAKNVGIFIIIIMCSLLFACSESNNFAPVMDIGHIETTPKTGMHRVASGETLYAIAWRYGLDYRYLAQENHIQPPYTILTGQMIRLRGNTTISARNKPTRVISQTNLHSKIISPNVSSKPILTHEDKEPNYSSSGWIWPTHGKVIRGFSAANRGVDIRGKEGQPIYASASGKVVYSGNGLRGYGNLIIIKHNSVYLSAYAHNRRLFVKEGRWVKKGQKIGEMGDTGSDKVMLHFEIRRAGKPINPLSLYHH